MESVSQQPHHFSFILETRTDEGPEIDDVLFSDHRQELLLFIVHFGVYRF